MVVSERAAAAAATAPAADATSTAAAAAASAGQAHCQTSSSAAAAAASPRPLTKCAPQPAPVRVRRRYERERECCCFVERAARLELNSLAQPPPAVGAPRCPRPLASSVCGRCWPPPLPASAHEPVAQVAASAKAALFR